MDGSPAAMTVFTDRFYRGGSIQETGGVPFSEITTRNGTERDDPDGGVDGEKLTMLVVGDGLLDSCGFANAGSSPA